MKLQWSKISLSCTIYLLALCLWPSCQAQLHMELVKSQTHLIPVALEIQTSDDPRLKKIGRIILYNLNSSGQCMAWIAHDDQAAHYVARYRVLLAENNPGNITFNLKSIDHLKALSIANDTIELSNNTTAQVADQVSDSLYQAMTGQAGYFMTPIAYIEKKQGLYALKVSHINGFTHRTLLQSTQPMMSPSWSPDGTHIAYVQFNHGYSQIHLFDLIQSQDSALLTELPLNQSPVFSPDGSQLLFVHPIGAHLHVFSYTLADHTIQPITQGNQDDIEPVWRADGQAMYFTSNRDGSEQIYQYRFADQALKRMSFKGNQNTSAHKMAQPHDLIWLHRHANRDDVIVHQGLNHSHKMSLTQWNESPSMSPNHEWIIYGTLYGNRALFTLSTPDGKRRMRLIDPEAAIYDPAWSEHRLALSLSSKDSE